MAQPAHPLLSADEALAHILRDAFPLGVEVASVDDALGRALAMDVQAVRTQPPAENSAMDGYAVRAEDTQSTPARLTLVDRLFADSSPNRPIGPGEAARIMTGAPIPPGADAVVMQEQTRAGEGWVELWVRAEPGQNVRPAGEDAREGDLLLEAGTPVGLPEAGLLWGQGILRIPVHRRPRVGILSTGDELVDPASPEPGRILDSNGPLLAAAVRAAGGLPVPLGRAPDEPGRLRAALESGRGLEVLLTTGGASVGEKDFMRAVLASLGAEERFWRIAIKPGKPVLHGVWEGTRVFGLPGNPTSALVTFELFVRPLLRRLQGLPDEGLVQVPARAAVPLKKAAGLRHFLRARVESRDGALWATPLSTQGSGLLRSSVRATHLLVLPEDVTQLAPGDPVGLVPLHWMA
jgi:molybdopterin molybdotransferase